MTSSAAEHGISGSSAAHVDELTELTSRDITEIDTRPFFFRHITVVVKLCTVLLVAGMWVCIVFLLRTREAQLFSAWYCFAVSAFITLLELVWFFSICVFCKDDGGCCCTCWRILMWLDNWKKALLYVAIVVPAFIHLVPLAIVCGVLAASVGCLYMLKSCANCSCCVGGKKYVRRTKNTDKQTKTDSTAQRDAEKPAQLPPTNADDSY